MELIHWQFDVRGKRMGIYCRICWNAANKGGRSFVLLKDRRQQRGRKEFILQQTGHNNLRLMPPIRFSSAEEGLFAAGTVVVRQSNRIHHLYTSISHLSLHHLLSQSAVKNNEHCGNLLREDSWNTGFSFFILNDVFVVEMFYGDFPSLKVFKSTNERYFPHWIERFTTYVDKVCSLFKHGKGWWMEFNVVKCGFP